MTWVYRRPPDYRAKPSALFAILAVASSASGTAAVTVTPTGALTGVGALAGVASITITPTGATAGSNCSGVVALTLTPLGAATAIGQMTGSSALVFANSATPIGEASYPLSLRYKPAKWRAREISYTHQLDRLTLFPLNEATGISGQCDISIGGTATLRASGVLAGSSAVFFGGTPTLVGTGAAAGACAITITPTAAASGTASGAVTGTATFTFGAQGTVLATGRLSGVSAGTFGSTLAPGSIQPITGYADMTFAASGILRGQTSVPTPRRRTFVVPGRSRSFS